MRNKVKRTLSFLLTFVMLCSLLPAMALAKEPEGRYEEVEGTGAITENAKVEVYTTKGGGHVERTGDNLVNTTFPQMTGYREYTATPNTDWVFDTWRYEQWVGRDENNRKDVGNDTEAGKYSFSNTGDDWYTKYETGNRTISVNRLLFHGDLLNPIVYKVYANFNPTIKATADANGTISDAGKQVEVTYGDDQAFTITANDGYVIETITVDGQEVAEGKNEESYTYTFENVIEPHTINVTFKVKPEPGKFTVTYEVFGEFPAGYEIPDAVTVNEGDIHTVADVPQNVTTDEGTYTFDGWNNGKDKVGATIAVTSDVTLTGVWTFEGKDDVWNTVYGTIRVYMDEETKADFDALEGNLAKQVRLYSEKYLTDGYRLCGYEPINDFWYTTNSRGVTANDISKIVLAKDKAFEPSSKIEIPIKESGDYTVTVTEGTDKVGWISYSYLRIDITKNAPVEETVQLTYDMNGGTGENVTVKVPKGTVALDDVQNPTHDPVGDRAVVFKGWSTKQTETIYEPDAVPTDLIKTTLENVTEPVTVYAVWAYETAQVPVSGKTVEVIFTVNPDYGTFTEYGKGPVTFKNIDAESTQQFEVPKVTANAGYKFVGWKGQGADVIEWDANASTFGVPGLCYFAEGSNVGYASIEAVFEKEGGGHTNDYYVIVIVDGKGKVKAEDYGTVDSNETEVIIIPDVENSVKFTMEPADGWKVDDVLVDGKSVGDVDSYVLKDDVMLEGPVLKVIFEKKSSGGGGGGSHDKDDEKDKTPAKTPDALNGEDHFDYIVGDADGRVHPERNITRAEVASIFFRLLKDDVRSENLTDQNTFTDVSADAWYNVAVSTMSDMDIVFGRTDYQFDPDAYITRAEFAAIAARFDSEGYSGENLFTDIDGHWAANQINRAAEKGWISGYPDGTFGPDRYITRAEAVTMINRVLNRLPESADALHEDMKVFVDNADTNAWYYLAIQEATSSHEYKKDKDGVYETWTDVLPARDWAQYLKLN